MGETNYRGMQLLRLSSLFLRPRLRQTSFQRRGEPPLLSRHRRPFSLSFSIISIRFPLLLDARLPSRLPSPPLRTHLTYAGALEFSNLHANSVTGPCVLIMLISFRAK